MKWNSVRSSLLALGLIPTVCGAENLHETEADTIATLPTPALSIKPVEMEFEPSIYEQRQAMRMERWKRIIPSHYKLQFAGSVGMFSLGVGWTYGKKNRWETDLQFGLLPKFNADDVMLVVTLKESYIPWRVRFGTSHFALKPFACGLFISSVLNHNFWVSEPDRYPGGYYGFSTRLRLNVFVGQRITYYSPKERRKYFQGVSAYYELSACDTDLVTFFGDKVIKFKDILSLGLGLKVHI